MNRQIFNVSNVLILQHIIGDWKRRGCSHSKENFECVQYSFTTAHNWSLKEHVKAVHSEQKDLQGYHYSYATLSISNLKMHINAVHNQEKA